MGISGGFTRLFHALSILSFIKKQVVKAPFTSTLEQEAGKKDHQ
jgi:hypothetical protein